MQLSGTGKTRIGRLMALRILCFNIHGGYDMRGRRDLRRIHGLMQDYDIDIGVFQEIETRKSRGGTGNDIHLLAGPERPYWLPGLAMKEEEGWYGNLIVSRYPIERSLVHDLRQDWAYEPRNAVDALIATPLGKIRIIGTHLSLTVWERWPELQQLISLMREVEREENNPLLLMGDINEWYPRAHMLRYLNKLMRPVPSGGSFPSFRPILRLDRVWQDHCPFPVSAKVLHIPGLRNLSDHLPLLVTAG
jgi:endonuclease/exonuclease/phosphatase family metal-dependent hydrolase